jgi:hypothetical protein
MKLATLRDGSRDGRLLVVRADGAVGAPAPAPWTTMQRALDDWDAAVPALTALAAELASGALDGLPIDPARLAAPLPRAYEWVDGSAYLNHVILVRKARKAEPPATLTTDPLVYQGGSGDCSARATTSSADPAWGLDYESEVVVILGDTPRGSRGRRRALRPAHDAGQRRDAAQPHPRRAGQGLRLLPVQARHRVLAVRGHARRAGRRRGATAGCTPGCARPTTARSSATATAAPRCTSRFTI